MFPHHQPSRRRLHGAKDQYASELCTARIATAGLSGVFSSPAQGRGCHLPPTAPGAGSSSHRASAVTLRWCRGLDTVVGSSFSGVESLSPIVSAQTLFTCPCRGSRVVAGARPPLSRATTNCPLSTTSGALEPSHHSAPGAAITAANQHHASTHAPADGDKLAGLGTFGTAVASKPILVTSYAWHAHERCSCSAKTLFANQLSAIATTAPAKSNCLVDRVPWHPRVKLIQDPYAD